MDFPKADPQRSPPPGGGSFWAAAALVLALYTVVLVRHVGAVAGGSDSSGYMNHARLLASENLHVQPRIVPGLPQSGAPAFLYVPLGFKPAFDGNGLVPTYPSGFALFVLLAEPIAGWRHAGDIVIVLHSLAGLMATFILGRILGLGTRWATLGAAVVAASPLYLFMSLQAMSDVPSLVWTTVAVLAALQSRKESAWALFAGVAMAVDVLLRPTNVLAFVPVAIALGGSPRRWIYFVFGGLPGAVFFAAHGMAAYGSFVATGYGDNSYAFMSRYVPETLAHYGRWLPALLTPIVALNLGLPWLRSETARTRWVLGAWMVVYAAFFSAYECTHETWWYLRFLLPAAPAMAVGALLVARSLLARAPAGADPGRSTAACSLVLALIAVNSVAWCRELHALSIGESELRYGLVADWMKKHVPADAVCLTMQTSGALFYYTQFTFIRWDVLDKTNVSAIEDAIRSSKRPLYAVLFPFELTDAAVLDKRMPGHWTQVGSVQDLTIWRRDFEAARP